MESMVLSINTAFLKIFDIFERYRSWSIRRQASGLGGLQGLAAIGTTGVGLAIQPGGAINNMIVAAVNQLTGKFIIFTSL